MPYEKTVWVNDIPGVQDGTPIDADNMNNIENGIAAIDEKTGPLTMERLNKDANDLFTEIQYKRQDATLFKKSVLSGGASPQYTTRTVTFYAADGTTVVATQVYTLNYTGDDLTSEVIV